MKVAWRAQARANLRDIVRYIADRNAIAASDLNDRIQSYADRLVQHPQMHRPGRVAGTREALVHPNYILVYRITDDAIEIVNVIHTRREYPPSA